MVVAQSYSKLITLTRFEFDLGNSSLAQTFYYVFMEYSNNINDALGVILLGRYTANENNNYPCRMGFYKLCMLSVEDNFVVSEIFTFLILAVSVLLISIAVGVCRLLKKSDAARNFQRQLTHVLPFAFLLENNIEFWFILLLNCCIQIYEIAILSIFKGVGFIVFAVYLLSFAFILRYKKAKYWAPTWVVFAYERMREVLQELCVTSKVDAFFKGYLVHDFLLGAVGILGRYFPRGQSWAWAGMEVVLVILIIKYKLFKTNFLHYRQVIVEILFLALSIQLALVGNTIEHSRGTLISCILATSLLILFFNVTLVLYEYTKSILKFFKNERKAKEASNKVVKANLTKVHSSSLGNSEARMLEEGKDSLVHSPSKKLKMVLLGALIHSNTPKSSLLPVISSPTKSPISISKVDSARKKHSITFKKVNNPISKFAKGENVNRKSPLPVFKVMRNAVESHDNELGEPTIDKPHKAQAVSAFEHSSVKSEAFPSGTLATIPHEASAQMFEEGKSRMETFTNHGESEWFSSSFRPLDLSIIADTPKNNSVEKPTAMPIPLSQSSFLRTPTFNAKENQPVKKQRLKSMMRKALIFNASAIANKANAPPSEPLPSSVSKN